MSCSDGCHKQRKNEESRFPFHVVKFSFLFPAPVNLLVVGFKWDGCMIDTEVRLAPYIIILFLVLLTLKMRVNKFAEPFGLTFGKS